MGAALNLTNELYGRLTGVRRVGTASGGAVWLWRCNCGNELTEVAGRVRSGSVRSCGCLRRDVAATRNGVDLAGQRFGRLSVLARASVGKFGQVIWSCLCDCGLQTLAGTQALRSGGKKSCGCYRREVAAQTQRAKALSKDQKRANVLENRMRQREKRKSDPLKAMQARLSRLHRHALKQVGAIKTSPTFEQLGYSAQQFVEHIERQFSQGMGWHNMGQWQIDHIIPVSEARHLDDVISLNQLSNLRPMWSEANNRKKNRREYLI